MYQICLQLLTLLILSGSFITLLFRSGSFFTVSTWFVDIIIQPFADKHIYKEIERLNRIFPENKILQDNFENIKKEVASLIGSHKLPKFGEVYDSSTHATNDGWKILPLFFLDRYNNDILYRIPILGGIVKSITLSNPDIVLIQLSVLEPGQDLPLHTDNISLKYRYHLPIIIDSSHGGCCMFIVGEERWKVLENEPFIFNETVLHGVENTLGKCRVHLMIDILQPNFRFARTFMTEIVKRTRNAAIAYNQMSEDDIIMKNIIRRLAETTLRSYISIPSLVYDLHRNVRNDTMLVMNEPKYQKRIKDYLSSNSNTVSVYNAVSLIPQLHYLTKNNGYVLSMLPVQRLAHLHFWTMKLINDKIKGGVLEAGVWRGGTGILWSDIVKDRPIYMLDSFESMEDIEHKEMEFEKDRLISEVLNSFRTLYNEEVCSTSLPEVEQNFISFYGQVPKNVKFIKGWFDDLNFKWESIGELCVLRLDCDYYKPTKICLDMLYSRLNEGGIVILDEYFLDFFGEKTAVDEFRHKHNICDPIIRIDDNSAFWIKSKQIEPSA